MSTASSLEIRHSHERGLVEQDWLKSFHSFSFGEYHDPAHMHFGPLRVINEDWIAIGAGFGTHGHKDMEIITYVLEGELAHKDSMMAVDAPAQVIRPGDVQRMSAGRGVRHSEFNHAPDQVTHLLQIWIMPNVIGIEASYEEKHFEEAAKRGRLCLIASGSGADGSVKIHQDAKLYAGFFDGNESANLPLAKGRQAYVHVARGSVKINDVALQTGDALKMAGITEVMVTGGTTSEILVFDLGQ